MFQVHYRKLHNYSDQTMPVINAVSNTSVSTTTW